MKLLIALAVAAVTATGAIAQHAHSDSNTHTSPVATEPGHAGFAAIAEITALLRSDPMTDWARVDIEALRQHLIDMDVVTRDSEVSVEKTSQGARFVVKGTGRTLLGIKAMVPAHAPFLMVATGWDVAVTPTENGVLMQVEGDPEQINALGFIGLMTIGTHHPEHHLMMAKGNMVH